MTPNDLRSGNRNSPDRFETDSKPMNSHGMRPTTPSTCTMRGTSPGANAGPVAAVPWRKTAAPAKTRMPATKTTDRTVCTAPASRRRQQIAAAAAMAIADRAMWSTRTV